MINCWEFVWFSSFWDTLLFLSPTVKWWIVSLLYCSSNHMLFNHNKSCTHQVWSEHWSKTSSSWEKIKPENLWSRHKYMFLTASINRKICYATLYEAALLVAHWEKKVRIFPIAIKLLGIWFLNQYFIKRTEVVMENVQ